MLAHDDQEAEWWYVHGTVATDVGHYAFHLAFFRHRADRVRAGGILPVHWFGQQLRFAHCAVTECDSGRFHFTHRRAIGAAAGASAVAFRVSHEDWSLGGTPEGYRLAATACGIRLELALRMKKPLCPLRASAPGGAVPAYESCPRLHVAGRVWRGAQAHAAEGEGWLDHEWGRLGMHQDRHGWDWFGLQFEDGREFLLYGIRDRSGAWSTQAFAALVAPDGTVTSIAMTQVELTPLAWTRSPHTGIVYPVEWTLAVGSLSLELRVTARAKCHELDTRGSTCVIYWEGPVVCTGCLQGLPVSGRGFVERTGGDHLEDRFGVYHFERGGLGFVEGFANEARFLLRRKGVTRTDAEWPVLTTPPPSRGRRRDREIAPCGPPC